MAQTASITLGDRVEPTEIDLGMTNNLKFYFMSKIRLKCAVLMFGNVLVKLLISSEYYRLFILKLFAVMAASLLYSMYLSLVGTLALSFR